MIHGIGTDILYLDRIRPLYEKHPDDPFFRSAFTEKERRLISSRPSPLHAYASRFAGKEAVFKAMQIHPDDIRLNEIEILEDEKGIPAVTLHGNALRIADQLGIGRIHLSLSFENDCAVAFAVCESSTSS